MITLSGRQLLYGDLRVPGNGQWELRAHYEGKALSGSVAIDWRGWKIQGGAVDPTRSGAIAGQTFVYIVGGLPWSVLLEPKSLTDDRGILASTIANTLSDSLGQTIVVSNDRSLGRYFMRRSESGGQVLSRLFGSWYVGTDGTTRTGTRTQSKAGKSVVVLQYDAREKKADLYADRPDQCLPGALIAATSRHVALVVNDLLVTVKDGTTERITAYVRAA